MQTINTSFLENPSSHSNMWNDDSLERCPRCKKKDRVCWIFTCGGPTNAKFYYCQRCKVYFKLIYNPAKCLGCKECNFDPSIVVYGKRPILIADM